MDRVRAMEIFVAVAENASFAAAARKMSMSPPSVSREIGLLEDRLGTRLLVRTTRSVRPTESGARYLEDCRRLLAEIEDAETAAAGSHAAPRGLLRITAPVLFGGMYVTPLLGNFLETYKDVSVETMFVDRIVHLLDEGQDIAVRIGDLPDSSLVARRVGQVTARLVAAPAYLDRYGAPATPSELAAHRLIGTGSALSLSQWTFANAKGVKVNPQLRPRVVMNTNDAVRELVLSGWGVARLLSYQVAPWISDGGLVPLLEEYEPPAIPIHIVHPEGRRVSAKVRAFADFAADRLRADPSLNPH